MGRLRVIRRSVSSSDFLTIVHVFIFSRLDYFNSLYADLPKTRLSSLLSASILNSAVRLISRRPCYSRISYGMTMLCAGFRLLITFSIQFYFWSLNGHGSSVNSLYHLLNEMLVGFPIWRGPMTTMAVALDRNLFLAYYSSSILNEMHLL